VGAWPFAEKDKTKQRVIMGRSTLLFILAVIFEGVLRSAI
jgi:hypothetical protein